MLRSDSLSGKRALYHRQLVELLGQLLCCDVRHLEDVKLWVLDTLSSFHEVNDLPEGLMFEPEYFEIVDDRTLQPIATWDEAEGVVGCIAVWLDGVRLIDMVRFK